MQDETNGAAISADDDGALVARVRSGDLDAYAELVHRHAQLAIRAAVLLGAGDDAEDVVQDALVKAYRSLGRFRDGSPFRPWLLRIVTNEARNHHRSAVRRRARELAVTRRSLGLLEPMTDLGQEVVDRERKARLLAAVGQLPDKLRAVVMCRYLLDLDEAETSTILGIPRGTVKSRLSRGLARLRKELAGNLLELTDEEIPDGKEAGHG
jgi:RNA polymerase sigma-70 factor (ECF subfamily)